MSGIVHFWPLHRLSVGPVPQDSADYREFTVLIIIFTVLVQLYQMTSKLILFVYCVCLVGIYFRGLNSCNIYGQCEIYIYLAGAADKKVSSTSALGWTFNFYFLLS